MKKLSKSFLLLIPLLLMSLQVHPHSPRHHLIDMGKSLIEAAGAPLYGTFVQGPKNIKDAYEYEVWEREKEEKRGQLRYKLFALWRAPGEETKGIIDGVIESVRLSGKFLKELLSIFFSD